MLARMARLCLLLLLCLAVASPAEAGWGWPKMLGGSGTTKTSKKSKSSSWWPTMPSLWPASRSTPKSRSKSQSSTLGRISSSTKKAASSAALMFQPWKWGRATPTTPVTGTRRARSSHNKPPEKASWGSWLFPPEKPKQPTTVKEWMALERQDP